MSNSVQMDRSKGETVTLDAPQSNAPVREPVGFTPYSPACAEEKPTIFRWWVIVLIILAAPMLLAFLSIPFSIIMAIGGFVFGLGLAGVSLIAAGIASLISVPLVIFASFGSGVLIGGLGLMSIGFGILFLIATTKLVKFIFGGSKFLWRKISGRGSKREYGFDGGTMYGQQQ